MAVGHLFAFLILLVISSTVSSAKIQPTAILVQEGRSVLLKIQTQLPQFDDLVWIKHPNDVVVSYSSEHIHIIKDRVDFNKTTFSITLKNTWLNDSGVYEAKTSGIYTNTTGLYNVTVGPVSHASTIKSIFLLWMFLVPLNVF